MYTDKGELGCMDMAQSLQEVTGKSIEESEVTQDQNSIMCFQGKWVTFTHNVQTVIKMCYVQEQQVSCGATY